MWLLWANPIGKTTQVFAEKTQEARFRQAIARSVAGAKLLIVSSLGARCMFANHSSLLGGQRGYAYLAAPGLPYLAFAAECRGSATGYPRRPHALLVAFARTTIAVLLQPFALGPSPTVASPFLAHSCFS